MEWLIPYKVDEDTPASDAPVPPSLKAVSRTPQAKLLRVAAAGVFALTLERWLLAQRGAPPSDLPADDAV